MPTIPWLPGSGSQVQKGEAKSKNDELVLLQRLQAQLDAVPTPLIALTAFSLGVIATATSAFFYARYGRRLWNSDWATPDMFARRRWIKGVVTSVGDADNFRLYHTPALGWHWPFKWRRVPSATKDLKDQTLHIRIAGVDAPEAAHFGRPAQPYAAESLAWLRQAILGKVVYCQLIHRDQYSRIVANVTLTPRILPAAFAPGKNLALEMLRTGNGTIYEQAGAVYGKEGKEEFLRVEAEAKAARRGMWVAGIDGETPAEYKRRHASAASPEAAEVTRLCVESSKLQTQKQNKRQKKGWIRRLLGW